MSLTPDYFISSCGYPVLNREKFKLHSKLCTRSSPSPPSSSSAIQYHHHYYPQQQQQQQQQHRKLVTSDKNSERNMKNVLKFNCCDISTDNNRKVLLTKRRMRHNAITISNTNETTIPSTMMAIAARQQQQCNRSNSYTHAHDDDNLQPKNNSNNRNYSNKTNNNNSNDNTEFSWNWANDKEMKCFVNERIKECSKKQLQQQHHQRSLPQYYSNLR